MAENNMPKIKLVEKHVAIEVDDIIVGKDPLALEELIIEKAVERIQNSTKNKIGTDTIL
jgi:hypothetical protein